MLPIECMAPAQLSEGRTRNGGRDVGSSEFSCAGGRCGRKMDCRTATRFTPEVGTLTSMMAFTREQVVDNVKGLSAADLDFLLDGKANTIGALLLHLAATETYYQFSTLAG